MAKINKRALIDEVYNEVEDITKKEAKQAMERVIDTIVETLADREEVSIAGLGIFRTRLRKSRTARNPRTGEPIEVPAMHVPKFRPAKALKEAVRENEKEAQTQE
jgi:DNA-binding protein HU-beta